MFSKIGALVILTLCFLVGQSVQNECVPLSVVNLKVVTDHFLTWDINPDEQCGIDEFLVYIFHRDQPAEYAFSSDEKRVDVSFLEVCDEWTFVVVPVSGHISGPQLRLVARLPLHTDADLSLSELKVNQDPDSGWAYVSWNLIQPSLGSCSLEYKVSAKKSGSPILEELFVEQNMAELHFLAPCTAYELTVVAYNKADPSIKGPSRSLSIYTPRRKQGPPVLINGDLGTTQINLTFRLESEARNPCALNFMYIDGGYDINENIGLKDHDRSLPVNVTISNLKPNTLYSMKVYVDNVGGWSNASEVSVQTLEEENDLELIEKPWKT